ncbi:type III pantothenate kinase [Microbulbifer thermotolerans]|nr:type III pantothenate kinase [Microbulbifer thermotolerans]
MSDALSMAVKFPCGGKGMILEVDLGNTRGKWRLISDGEVEARGTLSTADLCRGRLPEGWRALHPKRVRAANVAGARAAESLAQGVRQLFGLPVEFARVETRCAGVTCGYRDVRRLGVDRWLAVLAAHEKDPRAALIVDCGSAVTLDLLDNGGRHLGGYIVPGLKLMRRALYKDTDAVKVPEMPVQDLPLAPGQDTQEAVNRGLLLMVLGTVELALCELRRICGQEPLLWLTGGDGQLLSPLCQKEHRLVPELVLDGLSLTNP